MFCVKCNNDKSDFEFHISSTSKNGHQSYCKICISNIQKDIYKKDRDNILERKKIYRSTCSYKERSKKYELYYKKTRKLNGKSFKSKFGATLREFVHRCLRYKGIRKMDKKYKLLGYDPYKLKLRIECQFKDGMSWGNYGK